MLTCADYIGYTVKFPGVEDNDTSMTLALNRLNIASSRSIKRRPNHLYSPYADSKKRRCISDPTTMRSIPKSQVESAPLRCTAPAGRIENLVEEETLALRRPVEDLQLKPWGKLISRTAG